LTRATPCAGRDFALRRTGTACDASHRVGTRRRLGRRPGAGPDSAGFQRARERRGSQSRACGRLPFIQRVCDGANGRAIAFTRSSSAAGGRRAPRPPFAWNGGRSLRRSAAQVPRRSARRLEREYRESGSAMLWAVTTAVAEAETVLAEAVDAYRAALGDRLVAAYALGSWPTAASAHSLVTSTSV
jgi:hypothetical protein